MISYPCNRELNPLLLAQNIRRMSLWKHQRVSRSFRLSIKLGRLAMTSAGSTRGFLLKKDCDCTPHCAKRSNLCFG